jgi:hypothetical protein
MAMVRVVPMGIAKPRIVAYCKPIDHGSVALATKLDYMRAMDHKKDTPHTQDNAATVPGQPEEIGGSNKPEPTRYGDWEVDGRCTDF